MRENLSQLMRSWYLSHRRPAKAQVVSPEPSLFAHMKYKSGRRVRPNLIASLGGCACAFEQWVYGGRQVPSSHDMAHLFFSGAYYYYHPETNKSYEESLLDVKSYSVGSQIPYRYVQFTLAMFSYFFVFVRILISCYPKYTNASVLVNWKH